MNCLETLIIKVKYGVSAEEHIHNWITSLKQFTPVKHNNYAHLKLILIKYNNHHYVIDSKDFTQTDDIRLICKKLDIEIKEYKTFVSGYMGLSGV